VVGVDSSTGSSTARTWACEAAQRLQRPLHLIHAHDVELADGGSEMFSSGPPTTSAS
jgi:nucleotide-binding universal stress UspA family protein